MTVVNQLLNQDLSDTDKIFLRENLLLLREKELILQHRKDVSGK